MSHLGKLVFDAFLREAGRQHAGQERFSLRNLRDDCGNRLPTMELDEGNSKRDAFGNADAAKDFRDFNQGGCYVLRRGVRRGVGEKVANEVNNRTLSADECANRCVRLDLARLDLSHLCNVRGEIAEDVFP